GPLDLGLLSLACELDAGGPLPSKAQALDQTIGPDGQIGTLSDLSGQIASGGALPDAVALARHRRGDIERQGASAGVRVRRIQIQTGREARREAGIVERCLLWSPGGALEAADGDGTVLPMAVVGTVEVMLERTERLEELRSPVPEGIARGGPGMK